MSGYSGDPDMLEPPTAGDWDEWYAAGRRRLVPSQECDWVYQRVRPEPGMTAIDLGCGTGQWTRELSRWRLHVSGYDFSGEALARARSAGERRGLSFQHWDLNSHQPPPHLLPASVDLVTCRNTMAYLNQRHVLRMITRVLKPSGALYVRTPAMPSGDCADPFGRGLTEEQITAVQAGWASSKTQKFSSRSRGILLRGYGG